MGRRTASKKQDVADQIDKALTNLGVDPDTLATFKRDYLSFARYDLFQTFDAIVSLNVRENKLSPKPMSDLLAEFLRRCAIARLREMGVQIQAVDYSEERVVS
jgi:hypothetical protein